MYLFKAFPYGISIIALPDFHPFLGWMQHPLPAGTPSLKVSGCRVLTLWKLDVEKVHVAKASSTDGHRLWLLLRWEMAGSGEVGRWGPGVMAAKL